jgi:hypothetical protein
MDPLGKGLAQIPLDMPARLPASWGARQEAGVAPHADRD